MIVDNVDFDKSVVVSKLMTFINNSCAPMLKFSYKDENLYRRVSFASIYVDQVKDDVYCINLAENLALDLSETELFKRRKQVFTKEELKAYLEKVCDKFLVYSNP